MIYCTGGLYTDRKRLIMIKRVLSQNKKAPWTVRLEERDSQAMSRETMQARRTNGGDQRGKDELYENGKISFI